MVVINKYTADCLQLALQALENKLDCRIQRTNDTYKDRGAVQVYGVNSSCCGTQSSAEALLYAEALTTAAGGVTRYGR